jgi:TonB family protein
MIRRHWTIFIALLFSAAGHALLLDRTRHLYLHATLTARREETITLAFVGDKQTATQRRENDSASAQSLASLVKALPPPLAAITQLLDPAPPRPPEVEKFPNEMGDASGKGFASNAANGKELLHAREGDEDQGFLSRDPVGRGKVGGPPSRNLELPGQGGSADSPGDPLIALTSLSHSLEFEQPAIRSVAPPPIPAPPIDRGAIMQPRRVDEIPARLTVPAPDISASMVRPVQPIAAVASPIVIAPMPQAVAATVQPTPRLSRNPPARGANQPAADSAQESDSESDPFAKIGSAAFRDGKVDVRFGRKIKTTRPKVPIVGQLDSLSLRNPRVVLKVNIDPSGKVTSVSVHKSSGSTAIDEPCQVAMYDWWFEPLKDSSGKPIADCQLFVIAFR